MTTLLYPQFACPPQDNKLFLVEEEGNGLYVPAQPAFIPDETSLKTASGCTSELDSLLAWTSSDLLNESFPFPDFLSDSPPDFHPDAVFSPKSTSNCSSSPSSPAISYTRQDPDNLLQILEGNYLASSPKSVSNYSSNPSSPSVSYVGQDNDDLFQLLDGSYPASFSPNFEPSLDSQFCPTLAKSCVSAFLPTETFPSCASPNFTLPPSPSPPPSTSSPVKQELPVLTSLLGKRPAPSDGQSASKLCTAKHQRIRKKLPHTVMKQRKKEQNKDAALRYRQRKKEQQEILDQKCLELEEENSKLKGKVDDITREIAYLKSLWQEVVSAKQRQQHKSRLLH